MSGFRRSSVLTPAAILHTLSLLEQEAEALGLASTQQAIRVAIAACRAEQLPDDGASKH